MIPKDKAIAALSEINKLRHELNQTIVGGKRIYKDWIPVDNDRRFREGLLSAYCKLTESIERAFEILNNG